MANVAFDADGVQRQGYLALPKAGTGKGLLVLHAWWGLNDFFKSICDDLAGEGFVVFAPDLHHGKIATTPQEAEHILETRDFPAVEKTARAGLRFLQTHPAVQGQELTALGCSMGTEFGLLLNAAYPGVITKIVDFYGASGVDLSEYQTSFVCHYGDRDEFEPFEQVKEMNFPNAQVFVYPGAQHWFFESDRPGYYQPEAAALAWQRTLEFLGS